MKYFQQLLFLYLFSAIPLCYSSDLNHPLTVAEMIDIALNNHPETRQAWWNAQRAAAALGVAKSSYYPQVDANADISHGRDFKFINGPEVNYTNMGAELTVGMLLYDFGARSAGVDAAKNALLAANWQTDWTMQKVIIRVLENAYATVHAAEVLQAAKVSLAEAERMFHCTEALNRSGLNPITDVYTSEATLSQMKMDIAERCAQLEIQKGKLAVSLGLSIETPLQLANMDALPNPEIVATSELITLAKEQRSDLMAKQARVQELLFQKEKAQSAYGPKFSAFGSAGADRYLHDKTNSGQYQIGLSVEMPLFHGFETVYQNRKALADSEMSMAELAELEQNIALEVLTYSKNLEAAQDMLSHAADNLRNAEKAFDGTLQKYQAGKERIAEVSNAQRMLAQARVRFSDVKTRWLVAIANLAFATGTLTHYTEPLCKKQP